MKSGDYGRHKLLGYTDRLSARAGESITFFVSAPKGEFRAEVRRIRSVDGREGAGGVKHQLVRSRLQPSYKGIQQVSSVGNYAEFTDGGLPLKGLPLMVALAFWPSLLPGRQESVISFNGDERSTSLVIEQEKLHLVVDGARCATADIALEKRKWYRVALVVEGSDATLLVAPLTTLGHAQEIVRVQVKLPDGVFFPRGFRGRVSLAANKSGSSARNHYTGKIGDLVLASGTAPVREIESVLHGSPAKQVFGSRVIHSWSMGRNTAPMVIPNDVIGAPPLMLVNLPMRAVTGPNWQARRDHPDLVPDEYNAILFHADMVGGGDWKPTLELQMESDWRSGVYALRLQDGTDEDWIPFYVRPAAGAAKAKVLFIAPTNTYLAYANENRGYLGERLSVKESPIRLQDADKYVIAHPEMGASLYNVHSDGSGVAYASRLRPLLNFRPFHFNWLNDSYRHFAGDFYLLDWLEHHGFDYDVLTDEDLHFEGLAALEPYDAVLTGSHPEYVSSRMMETLQQFVDGGGHLMYLGGNGFYQVTSFHPDMPHVIEVRRAFSGHRNHTSQPGESAHAFTGDIGGLWRYRGLGSHRLTGVGSGALGFGKAGPYKLTAAARSEEHAWIFEGVSDDLIGAQGMMLGGAAGDEIDRTDASNGTPPQTVVLASSVGLSSHYQEFIEDVIMILPGENGTSSNPKVRADMTWLATRGGGAVFSVGSICWIGCLPINGYDNAVSRVTLNVLKRFTRKSAAC